jgi:hypothetical protein
LVNSLRPVHHMMRSHLFELRNWLVLFYIWAAEWLLNGAVQWYGAWKLPGWIEPLSAMAAGLASIGVLLGTGILPTRYRLTPAMRLASLYAAVPFGIAAGSLLLIEYLHAVDPFFIDLSRALLLSFFFACMGLMLGLELMLLGVWLFLVSLVTFVWYLGFAPMVLDFMGGFSLLACGRILSIWTRRPE